MPARLTPTLQKRQEGQSREVRAIAWKAQLRLCSRYRKLITKGKKPQVVVTCLARELSGFVWAIACTAMGKPPLVKAQGISGQPQPPSRAKNNQKTYQLDPTLKYIPRPGHQTRPTPTSLD